MPNKLTVHKKIQTYTIHMTSLSRKNAHNIAPGLAG